MRTLRREPCCCTSLSCNTLLQTWHTTKGLSKTILTTNNGKSKPNSGNQSKLSMSMRHSEGLDRFSICIEIRMLQQRLPWVSQCAQRPCQKGRKPEAAALDPFGGCDFTQIYPCEITLHEGQDQLETRLIRKTSPIPRTYAKCCFTPLFSTGSTGAALLNSDLLSPEDQHCEVKYRIIGRHALKGDGSVPKPSMSWSVPFGWFFAMPKRCQPEKAQPSPVEVKDIKELKLIEGFVEGK